ncbi:MAG: hypothetical protein GDA56_32120 [Hormoscilla sp. GM7CHS1pb]|nr:hypothetical protein [Hormoscilla sp. GM7CHS1pb]
MQKSAYLASVAATVTLGLLFGPVLSSMAQQIFTQEAEISMIFESDGQYQAPRNTAGGASRERSS